MSEHGHTTGRHPRSLHIARVLLIAIALSHLLIPIIEITRRGALRAEIQRGHPAFDSSTLDRSVHTALTSAVVFHGLLLALTAFLIARIPSHRNWVLRLTIVSQALSVLFALVSWSTSTMFHAVIPFVVVAQIVVIICVLSGRGDLRRSSIGTTPVSTHDHAAHNGAGSIDSSSRRT